MNLIIRILLNGLALVALDYFMDSISVETYGVAIIAVVILSIVNTFIRPILQLLALPITFLTLGLFALVVNGAMFYLTAALVSGFEVTSFFGAIVGAIFMSIISTFITKKD